MKKRSTPRRKTVIDRRGIRRWMTGIISTILTTLVLSLAYGGWSVAQFINNELASKEAVVVAGTKADFSLDQHMQLIIAQIARLEQKRNKTRDEFEQLKYLREQLQLMRNIRRGS